MLSERFREAPVIPSAPVQRATCFILEDALNHWFPRHALHSRWIDLDNAVHAGKRFGANMVLSKSIDEALTDDEAAQVAGVGVMMRDSFGLGACDVQGVGADKADEVRRDFNEMMSLFKTQFQRR